MDPDELDEGDEDEEVGFDTLDEQQQYFELNLEADGTTVRQEGGVAAGG